jgi:hypothetical protein
MCAISFPAAISFSRNATLAARLSRSIMASDWTCPFIFEKRCVMRSSGLLSLVIMATLTGFFGRATADNIVLKSGDTLTGTITQIGPETVDINTAFAGPIKVKREAIKSLRSDAKVTVVSAEGASHTAFIGPAPDAPGWRESQELVPVPPIAAAPAPAPTPAPVPEKVWALDLERYFIPIGPHWKNQFSLGVVNTTGNTESTNFAAELAFNYKEKPHEFNMKIGGVY